MSVRQDRQLARRLAALPARRVVEIGTSQGVSTLHPAAALRDRGQGTGELSVHDRKPRRE